jgi:hypothetical protein
MDANKKNEEPTTKEYEIIEVATQTRPAIRDKEGNIYDELTALELILNKLNKLERGLL